jgi:hypothetical protein
MIARSSREDPSIPGMHVRCSKRARQVPETKDIFLERPVLLSHAGQTRRPAQQVSIMLFFGMVKFGISSMTVCKYFD